MLRGLLHRLLAVGLVLLVATWTFLAGMLSSLDLGGLLDRTLAELATKQKVSYLAGASTVQTDGTVVLRPRSLAWRAVRRDFGLRLGQEVTVLLPWWRVLWGGALPVSLSAFGGQLQGQGWLGRSQAALTLDLQRFDPLAFSGPQWLYVEPKGRLSGTIEAAFSKLDPPSGTLKADLSLEGSLDIPAALGMLPPLEGVAVQAEIQVQGERLVLQAVQIETSLGRITLAGEVGSPGGQVLLTARPVAGLLEGKPDLAALARPYTLPDGSIEVRLRQERDGWRPVRR